MNPPEPQLRAVASTYGDRFVIFVRQYLHANNLIRLGQINATILADLAQQFNDKNTAVAKKARQTAIESDWVKELESEPANAGVDVQRELGKAQFWCKNNRRVCTRKFFVNWLLNPRIERAVTHPYDGASSRPVRAEKPRPVLSLDNPVAGWPLIIRNQIEGIPETEVDRLCSSDWQELPLTIRQQIIKIA